MRQALRRSMLAGGAMALLFASVPSEGALSEIEAHRIVREAKAAAKDINGQGDALARLAWPSEPGDPLVASIARSQLVGFGYRGIPALRTAATRVPRPYTADVAVALVQARLNITAGVSPDYAPAIEAILWFGSPTAKVIAMRELAEFKHYPAVPSMVDAAYEYPQILEHTVESLLKMGDPRARFFLLEVLGTGTPEQRTLAAQSLARLGGVATDALREAAMSEEMGTRVPAMDALLPVAGIDDLTTLHEYVALRTEDDPVVIERVRRRAVQLEQLLEEQLQRDAASGSGG